MRREFHGLIAAGALALSAAMALAACSEPSPVDSDTEAVEPVTGGGVPDGTYRVVAMDGRPVGATNMTVRINFGQLMGGHDGCSEWRFKEDDVAVPEAIFATQTCPEGPESERIAYRSMTERGPADVELSYTAPVLSLTNGIHEYTAELESAEG